MMVLEDDPASGFGFFLAYFQTAKLAVRFTEFVPVRHEGSRVNSWCDFFPDLCVEASGAGFHMGVSKNRGVFPPNHPF